MARSSRSTWSADPRAGRCPAGRDQRRPAGVAPLVGEHVVGRQPHELGAHDAGHDGDGAQHQRVGDEAGDDAGARQQVAEEDGPDGGDGVGLEEVGGHAGAVADVVAHVVGDDRRVARVVLGDAGLDLADQVGADVGALGEDAAAEPREDRDQRRAEGQADQRLEYFMQRDDPADAVRRGAHQEAVVPGHAEQSQADDGQPFHVMGGTTYVIFRQSRMKREASAATFSIGRLSGPVTRPRMTSTWA